MSDFDSPSFETDTLTEMCSRSLYTVDGLWFLAVEEKFGFEAAFALNQVVWERCSRILGRRLLKNLNFDGKPPLRALVEMLTADPMMHVHRPEVVTMDDNRAVFRCIECPIQVARIRDGRGVYNGEPGCSLLFKAYAELVAPDIEVKCVACAPNPGNPEYWCEWEFEIPRGKGDGDKKSGQ
jgi:hypothetical protein